MNRAIARETQPNFCIGYLDLPGSDSAKPPLIMLHGLGASAESTFLPIANDTRLRSHRRILIDLPGFGDSNAPDSWHASIEDHATIVFQSLDRLGLRHVSLVGHSMGGSIAIVIASVRPDLVANLIVAEPNLDPNSGTFSGQITRFSERAFIERGRGMILRALKLEELRNQRFQLTSFAESVAQASPVHLHRSAVSLRAERTPTFRAQLRVLTQPRLFIAGGDCIETISGDLPRYDIDLAVIAGAGHVMMHDDPDEFVRVISGFLIPCA